MKMKNILSGILVASMLFSLVNTCFAAETNFELVYSSEPTYEVIIPASGEIDVETGICETNITISEVNLRKGTQLMVHAYGPSADEYGSWHLISSTNPDSVIPYSITCEDEDGPANIVAGEPFIWTKEPVSYDITMAIEGELKVGNYSDSITFYVQIVESFISFVLEDFDCEALEGMTWREWIESDFSEGIRDRYRFTIHEESSISVNDIEDTDKFIGEILTLDVHGFTLADDVIVEDGSYLIEPVPFT